MSAKGGNFAAPADEADAVTPSDTAVLSPPTRALYVGATGDVKVDMALTGAGIVFKAVPTGTTLPISVVRVYATGTTASQIVAMW